MGPLIQLIRKKNQKAEKMSKAMLSLFCVATLFRSGLVAAQPAGSGDAVKGIADKGGNLANKAIEGFADGLDPNSLEAQGIGLAGDAVNAIVGGLGGLAGSAINGAESAANQSKKLANAGVDAGTTAIQRGTQAIKGNQGGQANSGNQGGQANSCNQGGQANSGNSQQSNGGNTVQIPTIFFLILAIFNH